MLYAIQCSHICQKGLQIVSSSNKIISSLFDSGCHVDQHVGIDVWAETLAMMSFMYSISTELVMIALATLCSRRKGSKSVCNLDASEIDAWLLSLAPLSSGPSTSISR